MYVVVEYEENTIKRIHGPLDSYEQANAWGQRHLMDKGNDDWAAWDLSSPNVIE